MVERYYLDTCIWRDYFENRSDKFRPLGEWAFQLIKEVVENECLIITSELVEEELKVSFRDDEIKNIFSIVPLNLLIKVSSSDDQILQALHLSKILGTPKKDTLHAILARDSSAILITRDKHMFELTTIVEVKRPEDLI